MIIRIVKLTFKPEEVDSFKVLFESVKEKIRSREGCESLSLLQDKHDSRIFFTYSYWQSESQLNDYRHSELFEVTWRKTKAMFDDKPQAWSVDKLDTL